MALIFFPLIIMWLYLIDLEYGPPYSDKDSFKRTSEAFEGGSAWCKSLNKMKSFNIRFQIS